LQHLAPFGVAPLGKVKGRERRHRLFIATGGIRLQMRLGKGMEAVRLVELKRAAPHGLIALSHGEQGGDARLCRVRRIAAHIEICPLEDKVGIPRLLRDELIVSRCGEVELIHLREQTGPAHAVFGRLRGERRSAYPATGAAARARRDARKDR
jgi:hypothetical protein